MRWLSLVAAQQTVQHRLYTWFKPHLQSVRAPCCALGLSFPTHCGVGLQAKLQKVQEAAGFVRVFEALRDSGKPAVGHNCLFDLTFTLEHLAEPLPEDWPAFKRLVQKWFPGEIRTAGQQWELKSSLATVAVSFTLLFEDVQVFMTAYLISYNLTKYLLCIWLFLLHTLNANIPRHRHLYLNMMKLPLYPVVHPQETCRGDYFAASARVHVSGSKAAECCTVQWHASWLCRAQPALSDIETRPCGLPLRNLTPMSSPHPRLPLCRRDLGH